MTKYCPNCGKEVDEDTVYCNNCGAEIDSKNPTPKIINNSNQNSNVSHTTELVLGILGGIFGILGAILAIMFSAFGGDEILMLGMSALIGSIVGIIGAVYLNKNAKYGGIILIISAIWVLISISLFGVLPAILLGIGGILALMKK
ncbi:DUF4064 domain-containing protein [Methanobrevibacter sp. UBA417]|jgi:RNA polymerase subunit RPABC4/transcription elongation factor Spt4|uniref:DUF4064 domain-containing protein n=1 Tax=Methanobrevibacter sp. UBA417 TaxID=1915487 RepID=UPI0039B9A9E6